MLLSIACSNEADKCENTKDCATDGGLGGAAAEAGGASGPAGAPPCSPEEGLLIVPLDGSCPIGTTARTLHTDPVATAGACSCGDCTPTAPPTCTAASLTVHWGSSNSCSSGPSSFSNVANGQCRDYGNNITLAAYNRWSKVDPEPGACTAEAIAKPELVTTTTLQECVPQEPSAICGALTAGERVCLQVGEGESCPGSYPNAIPVGDQPGVTCAPCACERTAGKCVVEWHQSSGCNSLRRTLDANGICAPTNREAVRYFRLRAAELSCRAAPGTATTSLVNPRTLCCNR
jgi:hypothetical protein